MISHYTRGCASTLHDLGGVSGHLFSFGLSQFHGHGSWLVCEVALTLLHLHSVRRTPCTVPRNARMPSPKYHKRPPPHQISIIEFLEIKATFFGPRNLHAPRPWWNGIARSERKRERERDLLNSLISVNSAIVETPLSHVCLFFSLLFLSTACCSMMKGNRPLVTDEPIKFEKSPGEL